MYMSAAGDAWTTGRKRYSCCISTSSAHLSSFHPLSLPSAVSSTSALPGTTHLPFRSSSDVSLLLPSPTITPVHPTLASCTSPSQLLSSLCQDEKKTEAATAGIEGLLKGKLEEASSVGTQSHERKSKTSGKYILVNKFSLTRSFTRKETQRRKKRPRERTYIFSTKNRTLFIAFKNITLHTALT